MSHVLKGEKVGCKVKARNTGEMKYAWGLTGNETGLIALTLRKLKYE